MCLGESISWSWFCWAVDRSWVFTHRLRWKCRPLSVIGLACTLEGISGRHISDPLSSHLWFLKSTPMRDQIAWSFTVCNIWALRVVRLHLLRLMRHSLCTASDRADRPHRYWWWNVFHYRTWALFLGVWRTRCRAWRKRSKFRSDPFRGCSVRRWRS